MRNFPSTDKWSTSPSPSSFSIDFRTFQRKGSEGNLEGNLNLSKITRRLVDLSIVTQTKDGGIKGGWYDVVKRDDRGTGYSYVVNPCLPKNRSIYIVRSSKISPTPCQSHRNLDAIWVKPSSPIPRSIPIEPTIPREWLESSPRAKERSRERERRREVG